MASQKMEKTPTESPELEQEICITCGFCCDGTLFENAHLDEGEHGNLPEKMEENYFKSENGEKFSLPCPYFDTKCSIYGQKKAHICSTFRCQLLKDFSAEKHTLDKAKKIISNTFVLREEIVQLYKMKFGNSSNLPFRKLLLELKKIQDTRKEDDPRDPQLEILLIKCNILEALLIRSFKSPKEYQQLMEESKD